MKTKRIAFILLLSAFLLTASFSSSTHSFVASPKASMITSQVVDPLVFTSNAELAQYSSSGVGTRNDPYIIEGLSITARTCLTIIGTTAFFIIRNCEFIDNEVGATGNNIVLFEQVEHGTLENCYVRGGTLAISISYSIDCSIINCVTYDAYNGIFLSSSSNITITDCNSYANRIGIMLVYSSFCEIINNSIYSNSERGVHVEVLCENNTIAGNAIGWNPGLNIIDYGVNTTFADDITFGNAYSDYNESEEYAIPGAGGSTDLFASLLIDTVRPTIFSVPDFVVDVENNDETITWSAEEEFHLQYQVSINEIMSEEGLWDGGSITVSLEEYGVGTYVFNFTVIDSAGNIEFDEVTVTVISFILGGIGTELVMLASGVTVVCFVAIILIVKRVS